MTKNVPRRTFRGHRVDNSDILGTNDGHKNVRRRTLRLLNGVRE